MAESFKRFLVSLLVVSILGLISLALAFYPQGRERKIVVFKAGTKEEVKENLIKKVGGRKIKDLRSINGKVVYLSKKEMNALLASREILRIDDDVEVFALAKPVKIQKAIKPQPPEVLPWGVDRIDAEKVWQTTTGDPIKVAIIDTGVDVKHPDLIDNLKGGVSTVSYTTSYNDDNGHGTHVAGIVGAIDNEIGVIGVAPKIDLYAVKVLDRRGSGYISDVIEGIEWVINQKKSQGGDWIINMSLGTSSDVKSFYDEIKKAYDAGITMVAAAGNTGGGVTYPAAYPEVIAVSATDENNQIASWSSRGQEIDLAAPGVNIYSTYKGSTYKTLSGTSMAAPHVTGAAALVIDTKKCDFNSDNVCTPAEVQQRLEQKAIDLGNPGKDELYGAGLVNVFNALY
jgi:subtilisin family serine protease